MTSIKITDINQTQTNTVTQLSSTEAEQVHGGHGGMIKPWPLPPWPVPYPGFPPQGIL